MTGGDVAAQSNNLCTWSRFVVCFPLWLYAVAEETDEVISAERPGFSSSPIALAPGVLQLEGGYLYARDRGSTDVDEHVLPLLLFRTGLTERVELQLGWAGWSWADGEGSSVNGANDATAGVKWQLNDADAIVPVALFAGVTLPVGDDSFGSDGVDPAIGLFWTYGGALDWFGTVLAVESEDDVSLANAVGLSLPIREDLSGFIEYFGNFADGLGPRHNLNGGIAFLPRSDLQLDLQAGVGLNDRASDAFLGFGMAYRF